MSSCLFTSSLRANHREELEELLFFNPNQLQFVGAIKESIQLFGAPQISESNDELYISLNHGSKPQVLFALKNEIDNNELLGIIIYIRADESCLLILHVAINSQECTAHDNYLFVCMMNELRSIARRINGIKKISMIINEGNYVHIPVK